MADKKIIKIGGSLYTPITAQAKELKIKEGDEVEILRKGKSIVITKVKGDEK